MEKIKTDRKKRLDEREKQKERLAKDFKPRFSASKIGDFCGRQSESTKIRCLRRFKPFSDIDNDQKFIVDSNDKKPKRSLLNKNEKETLKKSLDDSIDTTELTFDDNNVVTKFKTLLNDFSMDSDKMSQMTRYISCMRGRKLEDYVVARINKETNLNFEKNKKRTVVDFGMFEIIGIIDGINGEKTKILEIKTRNKNLTEKNTITNNERKQALTYMKMHQCNSCLFVELGPDGNIKKTEIEWDENKFNTEIFNKLNDFCLYARNLSEDEFKQLLIKHQIN